MRRAIGAHDSLPTDPVPSKLDALFGGSLRLLQPERGYRVNVDTLILAGFAAQRRSAARRVVDLGAGVGGLSLAFARFAKVARCDLVEREAALSTFARENLTMSGVEGAVHHADLAGDGLPPELHGAADVVLSNPPFFSGSTAPRGDATRRASRSGTVGPFLRAAERAMGRRAHAFFVYPADALAELLFAAREAGLVAKRLRLVHAYAHSEARVALVEFRKAKAGGLVVEPALVEWEARGVRSPELDALVNGRPFPGRGGSEPAE